ncbi:hypothetical protein Pse7367_0004 [Thalassoporum mexicanum PCC 7367]|uniref:calcium-binding protein n=1 Tax=Thalassoporum mexicanum TaxID=3457544 RepID=UPI00029FAA77|nr:calcium-binding protein [Pseudanabaena sp. PCC 7367]AFY68325.1 hypothetical protein Pse7367_0004 [Pseudanabaena sp. PCC 7367]
MSELAPYDSSWDEGNQELWDQKYEEWERRDWLTWLSDNLVFPFQVERMEDDFGESPEPDQAFGLGHKMKAIAIDDEISDDLYGIIIKAKEGRKTGYVPLADVEVTDKEDPNFWAVREYVVWFANR